MPSILALDVSSVSTGWSYFASDKLSPDAYGCIKPNKKQCEGAQLLQFEDEVARLICQYKPEVMVVESIFRGPSTVTFRVLSQFRGLALKTIYQHTKLDPYSILAVEARRILDIPSDKDGAFKAIKKLCGLRSWKFNETNDITDSIALALAIYRVIAGKAVINLPKKRKRKTKKGKQ
jgi:Holliday junction resolvasome RuvABC endonuclease subunit